MRLKRFLTALLSVALAAPPGAFAQSYSASSIALNTQSAQSADPPLVSGPSESYAEPIVPPDIAHGVFGVYGGAQSRFSGSSSSTSWRAPIVTQQLPDLGSGGAGALTPQAERKLGERVMREVRRDPDYLDDWLVRDYLNSVAAKLAAAASALYIAAIVRTSICLRYAIRRSTHSRCQAASSA
jgi:hypothetical protein